jgi:methionine-rich copper-binding protein CopC
MLLRGQVVALCALVAVLLVVGSAPAVAHADLASSSPASGESLTGSPDRLLLTFTEPVVDRESRVLLRSSDGRTRAVRILPSSAGTTLVADAGPALTRGTWTVDYRAVSPDGHAVEGSVDFSVGSAAPAGGDQDVPAGYPVFLGFLVVVLALGAAASHRVLAPETVR